MIDSGLKIIFCDVDKITRKHLATHDINKKAVCVIFTKSLNDLSSYEIESSIDANVISSFVYSRLSGDILKQFKNLKLISTRSTGYNNVDLDYCKSQGIKVVNVAGYGENTVAEFALGMLLNLTRKIGFSNEKLKNGIVRVNEDIGVDLFGKTVGVIGTGAIGRHFATLCKTLGCNVLAYDPFPNQNMINDRTCKYVTLNEVFKNSDVISLSCPATKENYHLINKATIAKMKHGVFIINTARGELIDTIDLYEALVSGKVGGAGLDVLDYEDVIIKDDLESVKKKDKNFALYSLINLKLVQLPNVTVTPHIAFNSSDAVLKILNTSLQTICDFIDGKSIISVI